MTRSIVGGKPPYGMDPLWSVSVYCEKPKWRETGCRLAPEEVIQEVESDTEAESRMRPWTRRNTDLALPLRDGPAICSQGLDPCIIKAPRTQLKELRSSTAGKTR